MSAFSSSQDGQARGSATHWVMPSYHKIKEPHIAALLRVKAKIFAHDGSNDRSALIASGLHLRWLYTTSEDDHHILAVDIV